MGKTVEELKEMIDSVITTNGNGQITGLGLNLVLKEMSDSLSKIGSGFYYIYLNVDVSENGDLIFSENKEKSLEHLQVYNAIMSNEIKPIFLICNDIEMNGSRLNPSGNAMYYMIDRDGGAIGTPFVML